MSILKIYKSSAGAGKTYQIVKEYLLLCLKNSNTFANILCITFTNKAVDEMKYRIITKFKMYSMGVFDTMSDEICQELNLDNSELQNKSALIFNKIIDNYHQFSIYTIDSFFKKIISSFKNELGLKDKICLDLDIETAIDNIVQNFLDDKNLSSTVTNSLLDFSKQQLLNGKNWNLKKELNIICKQFFDIQFVFLENKIIDFYQNNDLNKISNNLLKDINIYENNLKKTAKKAVKILKKYSLDISDFKYGKSGILGCLIKISKGNTFELNKRAKLGLEQLDIWIKSDSNNKNILTKIVQNELQPVLKTIDNIILNHSIAYNSKKSISKLFNLFIISSELIKKINLYRNENEVIFISDLSILINKLISQDNIPFIYQKIGSKYYHLFIDEFQDLSNIQWKNILPFLTNILSTVGNSCVIVGDSKQSIYRWRGGETELLNYIAEKDLGKFNSKNFILNNNWRSSKEIIQFNNCFFDFASKILKTNILNEINIISNKQERDILKNHINNKFVSYENHKQIIPKNKINNEGTIFIELYKNENDVLKKVYNLINRLKRDDKKREIAILIRNNIEGKKISDYFNDHGVEFEFEQRFPLYTDLNINLIFSTIEWFLKDDKCHNKNLAYLKVITNFIKIKYKKNVFNIIDRSEELLPKKIFTYKQNFTKDSILNFIKNLFYIYQLDFYNPNLQYLIDLIKQNQHHFYGSFRKLLNWWKTNGHKYLFVETKENAIKILTIHQSKGLEFDYVIIPFCEWEFDENQNKKKIIWSKNNYLNIPAIPIYYESNLSNSHFSFDYYKEKIDNYLDSLNILYVAFTRPKMKLFIYTPEKSNNNNISYLVKSYYGNFIKIEIED